MSEHGPEGRRRVPLRVSRCHHGDARRECYNARRLLEPIGNMPPAEAEARYDNPAEVQRLAACLGPNGLRETRRDSRRTLIREGAEPARRCDEGAPCHQAREGDVRVGASGDRTRCDDGPGRRAHRRARANSTMPSCAPKCLIWLKRRRGTSAWCCPGDHLKGSSAYRVDPKLVAGQRSRGRFEVSQAG